MAKNAGTRVSKQLRLIRSDLARIESRFDEKSDDLSGKIDGQMAVLIGFGKYIHDIDGRVESHEAAIGAKQ